MMEHYGSHSLITNFTHDTTNLFPSQLFLRYTLNISVYSVSCYCNMKDTIIASGSVCFPSTPLSSPPLSSRKQARVSHRRERGKKRETAPRCAFVPDFNFSFAKAKHDMLFTDHLLLCYFDEKQFVFVCMTQT